MRTFTIITMLGTLAAAGGGIALSAEGAEQRSDCPGTITCPLTGEEICANRCPAANAATTIEQLPGCCTIE